LNANLKVEKQAESAAPGSIPTPKIGRRPFEAETHFHQSEKLFPRTTRAHESEMLQVEI
jgi:hypothetical protein